jgi:hypothetical protein
MRQTDRVRFLLVAAFVLLLPASLLAQIPANDECAGAVAVSALPFSHSQDTRLATPNVTDPYLFCADSGGGKSVWFSYTADSTQFVKFTTANSTPTTYDVAMGLYTGSCGSLVEVDCNDDINPGSIRQSEITYQVTAGVTYIIQIAEWNGGGPSGGIPTGGDLVFQVSVAPPPPPIVQGPKVGSVPSGAATTTGPLGVIEMGLGQGEPFEEEDEDNRPDQPLLPTPDDVMPPKGPEGSNFTKVRTVNGIATPASKPVVLKDFEGFVGGAFPPDPIMAVGPNHVIAVENVTFRIWDKDGNLLKNISSDTWFANVAGAGNYAGDPQVLYDQFAQRWVMLGFTGSTPNHILISVSDDSDPIGTWYNWALPEALGDSTINAFADYPQMGCDENAIYVTTREFKPSFQYSRARIIPKAQLYANTAGPVTWTDFWDFREPQHPYVKLDGIRPSVSFTPAGVSWLVNASPYSLGTFFSVWTIHDPIGSPSITGANVPVVQYSSAPNPNQPGPAGNLFEGGGSVIRHKAVYRDSSLWIGHAIAGGTGGAYSALHYVRLNPFTNTNLEDVAAGEDGYWHFYPALMVDAEKNVIMTCTRTSGSEFAGAFVAGHRAADPPGLSQDILLKQGLGHYDPVLLGDRLRWGDYMGIGLDPVDTTAVWVHTQFASGTNSYKTWIGMVKMAPVPGRFLFAENTNFDFGPNEVGVTSPVRGLTLTNNGLDTLTISTITLPDSHFVLLSPPSLPIKLSTFESVTLDLAVYAQANGPFTGTVTIASDDDFHPTLDVALSGSGFTINAALNGVLYATSGASDGGRLLSVNTTTAAASGIGASGYTQIINVRVRPATNELYGLATNLSGPAGSYNVVRINASGGDAHPVANTVVSLVKGMAFRGDTLYIARINGAIYRVDLGTGAATQVASTGLQISGMDFHPATGRLWISVRGGATVDGIYKMTFPFGTPTLVGATGFGVATIDITFDANGNLFGLIGNSPTVNSLLVVDTASGVGSLIGSMGVASAQGLAMHPGTGFNTNTYRMMAKWNMVSVPLLVPDYQKTLVFPTAASEAFVYDGDFVERDTLDNGSGFWLRFGGASVLSIIGQTISSDTIPVRAKWNMIGSISDPVPVSLVASEPPGNVVSSYFGYGNTGYTPADTIYPGAGYWVKTNAAGSLILNAPAVTAGTASKAAEMRAFTGTLNSITVGDGSGGSQALFFGAQRDRSVSLEDYQLPPAAPAGIFDARFATQSMVALHEAVLSEPADLPVLVRSAIAPVRLSWNVASDPAVSYSAVVKMAGAHTVSTYVLRGTGQAVLPGGKVADLRIQAVQASVPSSFVLHQNYPNPFNPLTMIRYDLPEKGKVRLAVYDILGREIAVLVDQQQEAGYYSIPFLADKLSSGVYFYELVSGSRTEIKKMLLVR